MLLLTALLLLLVIRLGSGDSLVLGLGERWARNSYVPLQKGIESIRQGVGHFGTRVLGWQDLNRLLQDQQRLNQQLSLENMQLRESQAEVERLRRLLDYKNDQSNRFELEAARIIARAPNNWYKSLTVDKGANRGMAVDMPVITPDGLVGKIIEVDRNSAQVLLITDREMAMGAILQPTRENRGIVEGIGDGRLRMINIPYYSQAQEGDPVITSGLSRIYPKGLQIGTIRDVQKEANGLVLSAFVEPAVNFDRLEEVLIIKSVLAEDESAGPGE